MWIEMFFIKFEGKIENVRGNAENFFNSAQEFNEKHWNPNFFSLVKNKKQWEENYQLLIDIAFLNEVPFLRYEKFPDFWIFPISGHFRISLYFRIFSVFGIFPDFIFRFLNESEYILCTGFYVSYYRIDANTTAPF